MDKNKIVATLARITSGVLVVGVCGAAITLVGQVYLARVLGAQEYGWYVLLLAWMQILLVPAICGFDTAVLKHTATYGSERRYSEQLGLIRFSVPFVILLSVVISTSVIVVAHTFNLMSVQSRTTALIVAMCLLPVMSVVTLFDSVLRGLKKVVFASATISIVRPLVLIALVVLANLHFEGSVGAADALVLNLVAAFLSMLVLWRLVKKFLPSAVFRADAVYEYRTWFKVALPIVFMSGMHILLARIDVLMLGALIDPLQAGIYSATGRLTAVVGFALAAVNSIATPMLAEYFSRNDREKLQVTLTWSARIAALIALPAVVILYFFGSEILGLFGTEFEQGEPALRVLLIASVASVLAGSVGFAIVMGGQEKVAARIVSGAVVLNIVMNYFLIPKYGAVGAAISTSVCTVAWKATMVVFVRTKWRLRSTAI